MSDHLLVELLVEELPPAALGRLSDAFAGVLFESLQAEGVAGASSVLTKFATPRRLAAHLTAVESRAPDRVQTEKVMPVKVGLDAEGRPTPALSKKLAALGLDASDAERLTRASDGKLECLFVERRQTGSALAEALGRALERAVAELPVPKSMTYQLADGWTTVRMVRPAHGLVALHGSRVVEVSLLGLGAGRRTLGHRFQARSKPIELAHADEYADKLRKDGAVIASLAERRAEIARQIAAAASAAGSGLRAVEDAALLDEVTALVEWPNVLAGSFEPSFLEVPQECLILTMKAHQKYFPLLDAAGKLTNRFLIVANVSPPDPSQVIRGNERVVRPRLADAKFFFDQDRKKPLESRLPGLARIVYHKDLGSQAERVARLRAIARAVGERLGGPELAHAADRAAELAKADLTSEMVGEFPELQGVMGGYYAAHDGVEQEIAEAIQDHYRPRFAGDALPRNRVGVVVALADKLESLVGLFGVGQVPTGDKDPFALRRHALGLIRLLVEHDLPLELDALIELAIPVFEGRIRDPRARLASFVLERLAGRLREQGYSAQEVDAVLTLAPQRLADVGRRLAAVRAFAALPEAESLASANKRVSNILRKSEAAEGAGVSAERLAEPAEKALFEALIATESRARSELDRGDYTASLSALAALKAPVDRFFDEVLVNAEDRELRANRHALLGRLARAMNQLADLSKLSA